MGLRRWPFVGGAGGRIHLQLDIDQRDVEHMQVPEAAELSGDRAVRSDHPLVRAIRIRVEQITQEWGDQAKQIGCQ